MNILIKGFIFIACISCKAQKGLQVPPDTNKSLLRKVISADSIFFEQDPEKQGEQIKMSVLLNVIPSARKDAKSCQNKARLRSIATTSLGAVTLGLNGLISNFIAQKRITFFLTTVRTVTGLLDLANDNSCYLKYKEFLSELDLALTNWDRSYRKDEFALKRLKTDLVLAISKYPELYTIKDDDGLAALGSSAGN